MPNYVKKFMLVLAVLSIVSLGSALTVKADPFVPVPVPAGTLANQGPVNQKGTGFGAIVNILTLQNTGTETGTVTPSGRTGDATNVSQCATVTQLTAAGINAGNLAFVFNINQTGGNPTVLLNDFTVNFYSSTGTLLFSASTALTEEHNYTLVSQGTGGAGYLFTISGVDAQLIAFFSNSANCIGASASVSGADDGAENFYATKTTAVAPVPEPTSMLLLGTGLLGAAGAVRRRIKK